MKRLIIAFLIANAGAVAILWACGPFIVSIPTVTAIDPPDPEAFNRGEIGVIRPRLRRAYLAQAYRTISGLPPLTVDGATPAAFVSADDKVWRELRDRVLGPPAPPSSRTRRVRDYVTPINCLQDAIDTAVHTFGEREARYGVNSDALREWVRAQDAVFANCDEEPLSLPNPAPPNADALAKADREYQTAAAYFYGMQYEEAWRRFTAIGGDQSSPWRPYGHYLAARAKIRLHTMSAFIDTASSTALADAERELQTVIADPIAAPVHASARGLLTFVRVRLHPREQLASTAARIASGSDGACCALNELTYLLDEEVGDTVDYEYASVPSTDLRQTHDLVDWILAMQGQGPEARDRAVTRWQETKSTAWLAAALSKTREAGPAVDALLAAAAAVPVSSPAFPSVSFYRVRLLIDLGRIDVARAVLATLPDSITPGTSAETINLYRAARFMAARSFEELLATAARTSVSPVTADSKPLPIFDDDAGAVFNERMPLERLASAAQSTALPQRLRARVAVAAFTRAVLLDRSDTALALVSSLRSLAPHLSSDLDRYVNASTAEARKRAAILMILRTPGMTKDIAGMDDSYSIDVVEPRRTFDSFVPVWWCGPRAGGAAARGSAQSELVHLLYPSHVVPYPAFIGPEEQATTDRELNQLDRLGPGTRYLATATLEWARQRPTDPDVAEALARIVNGWRRACRDENDADLARQAFEALHRQFPNSSWAKQTKYWYR